MGLLSIEIYLIGLLKMSLSRHIPPKVLWQLEYISAHFDTLLIQRGSIIVESATIISSAMFNRGLISKVVLKG